MSEETIEELTERIAQLQYAMIVAENELSEAESGKEVLEGRLHELLLKEHGLTRNQQLIVNQALIDHLAKEEDGGENWCTVGDTLWLAGLIDGQATISDEEDAHVYGSIGDIPIEIIKGMIQ